MAYVPPPDDPNAQGQGQGQQAPGGGAPPVTTSAAPSGNGQGVTSVPGSATQPPVQNLQDYLAANQDQAVAMGKTIGDNLTAGANKVTGDIGADLSAVDNQVQASNVNPNAGLVNSAASDPTKFVTDPSNLAAFLQQENAKYTGPNAAEGTPEWAALTKEISDANAKMPDLSNPGAYLQLASGQETNPTTGMTNLDAALLQETPGASAPISAAAPAYAALQGQQSTAASAEDAAIAKAQANDVAASGLIAPAFLTGTNAEVPKWEAALKAELDNAQKGTDTYNTETNDQIAAMNSLFPIINGYESSNPNFTNLAAPPSLQQPSSASPTMASVATAQDYATENALQELLGSKFSTPPITQGTVGEAGSYSVPQFNPFDAQGYLNPLVENAIQDVGKLSPGTGYPASSPLNASEELASILGGEKAGYRMTGTPDMAKLEDFLGKLYNSNNRPTDIIPMSQDQQVMDYLSKISGGNTSEYDLNGLYAVQ